jgi:hypothetical protein
MPFIRGAFACGVQRSMKIRHRIASRTGRNKAHAATASIVRATARADKQ